MTSLPESDILLLPDAEFLSGIPFEDEPVILCIWFLFVDGVLATWERLYLVTIKTLDKIMVPCYTPFEVNTRDDVGEIDPRVSLKLLAFLFV